MKKRILIVVIAITMIMNISFDWASYANYEKKENNDQIYGENPVMTIDFSDAILFENINNAVEGEKIDFVEGEIIVDGEVITFGYNNINKVDNDVSKEKIKKHIKDTVNDIISTDDAIFPKYKVKSSDIDSLTSNIKIHKIKVKEGDLDKLEAKYKNDKKVKIRKYYEKITGNKNDIKDDTKMKKISKLQKVFSSWLSIPVYAEVKGGEPQGNEGNEVEKLSINPNMGDRQDRLKQKDRQDGGVYNWLPNSFVLQVKEVSDRSDHLRQVNVGFTFDSERLSNLNIDDDEALEAEVLFYNYGRDEGIPENGLAYMYTKEFYAHNIPTYAYPYEDTRFLDKENMKTTDTSEFSEVSYCIGIANTRMLKPDTKYWWIIKGYPSELAQALNSIPTEGLAKLQFNRSYNYADHKLLSIISSTNGHDEWSVFNEEYEAAVEPLSFKNTIVPKRYEMEILDNDIKTKITKELDIDDIDMEGSY